jgi:hypothetical protein
LKAVEKAHVGTGMPVEAFLTFIASAKKVAKTGARKKGGGHMTASLLRK